MNYISLPYDLISLLYELNITTEFLVLLFLSHFFSKTILYLHVHYVVAFSFSLGFF